MSIAPKYSKIELYDNSDKSRALHEDCGMVITGDHLIIIEGGKDSISNNQISKGFVYKLSDIKYYLTEK